MNWRKINRLISVTLLGVIQAVFLLMIFKENQHINWINIGVVILSLLIMVAHFKAPLHHEDHIYEHILVAAWLPIGAIATYYLNHQANLGPVIAAGIVGTIASFLPELNKRSSYLQHLPPVIYCGAFIGMSALRIADGFFFIIIASLFAAAGMIFSKSLFLGMGGKLGLIAFTGVVLASVLITIITNNGH